MYICIYVCIYNIGVGDHFQVLRVSEGIGVGDHFQVLRVSEEITNVSRRGGESARFAGSRCNTLRVERTWRA